MLSSSVQTYREGRREAHGRTRRRGGSQTSTGTQPGFPFQEAWRKAGNSDLRSKSKVLDHGDKSEAWAGAFERCNSLFFFFFYSSLKCHWFCSEKTVFCILCFPASTHLSYNSGQDFARRVVFYDTLLKFP